MQSNIILNHDCAWKSYRGMERVLNGFQSIRYVNGHVDVLYSCNVSFAVQYIWPVYKSNSSYLKQPTCACLFFKGFHEGFGG